MLHTSPFFEYIVHDVLRGIEGVSTRAMFGGYGLYRDGVIFGMIADDELFFKVDDTNRAQYEKQGSTPFEYSGHGKTVQMSYWRVPEAVIENAKTLENWLEESVEISLHSKHKKPKIVRRQKEVTFDHLRRERHPMPADIKALLKKERCAALYSARPAYQQNDYVGWITRSKRSETRIKRMQQMITELKAGNVYMKMKWNAKGL